MMADQTHSREVEIRNDKANFGFWVYLMTDLVMFATLFAAFAALRKSTFGGPQASELFNLPFVLIETLVLLTSSFSVGLGLVAVSYNKLRLAMFWFGATFCLGAVFLGMELMEFSKLIVEGNSFTRNAFLSSYFSLLGTHGLHIIVGLFWLLVMFVKIYKQGLKQSSTIRQLNLFGIFWHFLDLVWIFIFTIVYLMAFI